MSAVPGIWVVADRGYRLEVESDREKLMQLAQLGARVLEILREARGEPSSWSAELTPEKRETLIACIMLGDLEEAARSLGLLKVGSSPDPREDEERDRRATSADREQEARGKELDPYRNPESL